MSPDAWRPAPIPAWQLAFPRVPCAGCFFAERGCTKARDSRRPACSLLTRAGRRASESSLAKPPKITRHRPEAGT